MHIYRAHTKCDKEKDQVKLVSFFIRGATQA
jgi:hypothetical protein